MSPRETWLHDLDKVTNKLQAQYIFCSLLLYENTGEEKQYTHSFLT
jgi:hypothetical protein